MQVLVIAGFLGSGKTILLLPVARDLVASGRRLAIIENEVGAVGVDDRVLAAEGLQVRELYSGCVCCTLRVDLVTTLLALEREVRPDVVILEPSGVAGPAAVRQALLGYGGDLRGMTVLALADLPRFRVLAGPLKYTLDAAITAADAAVLTKADAVPAHEASAAAQYVQALRPDIPIATVSAETGDGMAAFLADLGRRLNGQPHGADSPPPAVLAAGEALAPRTAAAAAASQGEWQFQDDRPVEALAEAVSRLVAGISADAAGTGQVFGHIKAVLEVPGGGYAAYSLTGTEPHPKRRGVLTASTARRATVRVNAILCGIDKPSLQQMVDRAMATAAAAVQAAAP